MRLRTFESFWLLQNGLLYSYPTLQKKLKTEIIVVGGGITGALISDALVSEGYKVILVDRRDIGQGSTSATTSMLQYEIDEKLIDLSKIIGEENAAYCYGMGKDAITDLEKLVNKYKIDCGFEKKKSLYLAHNKTSLKDLHNEFLLREKYNLGVQWLLPKTIKTQYGWESFGGILSDTAASVDAYKLAHELIMLNCKKGMQVYDQTEISTINCTNKGVEILTEDGFSIKSKKIIFCNGFESTNLLKEKIAKLFYTYAMVSEQDIQLPAKMYQTLLWDTADPYMYIRTTADGRLLVGGEDEDYLIQKGQQTKKEVKAKRLQAKLKKYMPGIKFIEDFNWGGIFGSTKDGLPYIGETSEYKNAYFVLGFGGNGITFSIQGRRIILDLLKGIPNKLAEFYKFGR
jgi:glycine/D-amino acid oxidase-like deaminating enzyme